MIYPISQPNLWKNWREVLEGLLYRTETITITDQDISGVERHELTGEGWMSLESAPESDDGVAIDMAPEDIAEAIKDELLNMADELLDNAGFTSQYKGQIYANLLEHVRIKFLDGASLGLAEPHHLQAAWKMLPTVGENIASTPGLVEGMVKYGDK